MTRLGRTAVVAALLAWPALVRAESFLGSNPESYKGKAVGDGQCVAFVRECAKATATDTWKEGKKVRGNTIAKGTVIATFKDGKYPNAGTGNHAAIYESQTKDGIYVWDQWKGHSVARRLIRFKGGKGSPSNDGDAFSVVEK